MDTKFYEEYTFKIFHMFFIVCVILSEDLRKWDIKEVNNLDFYKS